MIRNNKKNISIIFFIFFLIYVFYHLFVSLYLDLGTKIIGTGFTDITLTFFEIINIKNILIHILTFIDISIGPSHLIKIIYPVFNNSLLTIFFSVLLAFYFLQKQVNDHEYNTKSFKQIFSIIVGIVLMPIIHKIVIIAVILLYPAQI